MVALRRRVARLADLPTTVLVTGETGTGKSQVARALHESSRRRARPLAVVDCASLPPSLVESELFGHEAGAFTGAGSLRRGRLESAGDGTLFLDEVGELPPSLQSRFLRVLEDGCFERLGGSRSVAFEARVVAATNVDLADAVRKERFRRDLLYRLDVVRLELPPLRERPEDLPELVARLCVRLCERLGRKIPLADPDFFAALAGHDWPGNVRELRNVLERMLVLGGGQRLTSHGLARARVGPSEANPSSPPCGRPERSEPERIELTLRESGGNVSRAARRLGLARSSLRRRIEKYGLEDLLPRD